MYTGLKRKRGDMSEQPESRLFLSYRRDDAEGHAGRLYDRLNAAFPGRIFRDVSGIDIGVDFVAEIERAISQSVVLVPIIGKRWLTLTDDKGRRRIDVETDFVRIEVASALARKVRTIPVLVSGATMPAPEELPGAIAGLSRWNALEITEADYDHDVERLIRALEVTLGGRAQAVTQGSPGSGGKVAVLRQQAESAAARADWLTAIQALQAAASLDPDDAEAAAQLRWVHGQHKLAGLYSDGQRLYQTGDKPAALRRFREVRVAGGNFQDVDNLISLLERELSPGPSGTGPGTRPPSRLKWVLGTLAAVLVILLFIAIWLTPDQPSADTTSAPMETTQGSQSEAPPDTSVGSEGAAASEPSAQDSTDAGQEPPAEQGAATQ